MSHYGFVVTNQGRALIAKLVAGRQLSLSRIMVGSGCCPAEMDPRILTDLIEPIAAGTSTTPAYSEGVVTMIVEYRSDLNGGLDHGFWLNEFGIFAFDPDDGEILMYYGSLGDYPQWVSAVSATGIDVRRYPVAIAIGDDSAVEVDYTCEAWMTAEDVEQFCTVTILPEFLERAQELIDAHNADPNAHFSIQNLVNEMNARISLLELLSSNTIEGNPFTVTFESLDDVEIDGIWNEPARRVEF